MKKLYSEQYISRLIDRFMAGETTLDEERILGEYFRTARHVPAEWDTYRQMFEYFDCGMDRPKRKFLRRVSIYRVAAAVLVAVLVLTVAFFRSTYDRPVAVNDIFNKVDKPSVAMVAVEQKSASTQNSVCEKTSGGGNTAIVTVPKNEVAVNSKPMHRALSSDSYRQSRRHTDADDSYKPSTVLSYDEIVKLEEQKKRKAYNEMAEAEYMNRREMGECCLLVENIDGYYEVKECIPDIILL